MTINIIKSRYEKRGFNYETKLHKETGTKYDSDGFGVDGYNKKGYNNLKRDEYGFDKEGYDYLGLDEEGYNKEGYNKYGFDKNDIHKDTGVEWDINGFNSKGINYHTQDKFDYYGFNRNEIHKDTGEITDKYGFLINKKFYDSDYPYATLDVPDSFEAYNKKGFNIDKKHKITNAYFNHIGYDIDGLDKKRFDSKGIHCNTGTKYNSYGYDQNGFNSEGKNEDTRTKYNGRGFNCKELFKDSDSKFNNVGFDIRGFNKDGFSEEKFHNLGYRNPYGYIDYYYDCDGYNYYGFNEHGLHKITDTEYDGYGFNKKGLHKDTESKYNKRGFDRCKIYKETNMLFDDYGYNIDGLNQYGFDKNGIHIDTGERCDKNGFNEYKLHKDTGTKYDSDGFDIDGYNKDKAKGVRKVLSWEEKLKKTFSDEVVDNNEKINLIGDLPKYVLEYLSNNYKGIIVNEGLKNIKGYIKKYRFSSKEKNRLYLELTNESSIKIIDRFKVNIQITNKKKPYSVEIPTLDVNNASISIGIIKENMRLLETGMWGIAEISFKDTDYEIHNFKPLQLSDVSIEKYKEARKEFATREWIDLIISTIGLNHKNYSHREKLVLISRQIPMVENNVFMMEFGKPGTGKTYTFENISSYSRVISGSQITAPQLFYNVKSKKEGLLSQFNTILFDEIDKVKAKGLGEEVTNKFYQYLSSGKFDRGEAEKSSNCSIMMVGNVINENIRLDELLHESNLTSAFLDRLNGVIPGWELAPVKNPKTAYSSSLSFSSDYFSEILNQLRSEEYSDILSRVSFNNGITQRDKTAIDKITSGLIKLIYPNGEINKEELREITSLAVEYRTFVLNQNYTINEDSSFNKTITFTI